VGGCCGHHAARKQKNAYDCTGKSPHENTLGAQDNFPSEGGKLVCFFGKALDHFLTGNGKKVLVEGQGSPLAVVLALDCRRE
jgi:hypothetical protein